MGSSLVSMNRWHALSIIVLAELCSLSLWFSASAVLTQLQQEWNINNTQGSFITTSVQLGFIFGAVVSTVLGLADKFNPRKLFIISSIAGALLNILLILCSSFGAGLVLRFLTGIAMAGVYPIAVKLVSLWFKDKKGISIGVLIAGLTLGSSLPHLTSSFTVAAGWEFIIIFSSILALFAALLVGFFLPDKSNIASKTEISRSSIQTVLKNRKVMLSIYGYWFHMWELYAMWTWLPLFLSESFRTYNLQGYSPGAAFLAIGISGAIGCIIGGFWADRIGKVKFTIIAMSLSALSAVLIGFTYQHNILLTIAIASIWGASIIADSGQFSAMVAIYSETKYVGTALTFQMAIGFLITVISIYLVSYLEPYLGWGWVFSILSIGPALGVVVMIILFNVEKDSSALAEKF